MKAVSKYDNQKVLVLGLARSGVSAARLLQKLGALVTVNDTKSFEENAEAQELLSLGIRVITGSHPVELLDEDFSLIVKNPGIPYTNPILEEAIKKKMLILTEVELAYQITEATIVGITGTNGKTTTTTLIGELLNASDRQGKAFLAGNIGAPASTIAQETKAEDVMVTELSSFQLMGVEEFRPKIAIITNLYEAHLDYHGSREEYVNAKWQIQKNMTAADKLILNGDQPELVELSKTTQAEVVFFSMKEKQTHGAYVLDGQIFYRDELIIAVDQIAMPGDHNVENALAAIIVAKSLAVDNQTIKKVLQVFGGVAHRTEFVVTLAGVDYYNDSKATNILATEKALSGFDPQKVILIAGGLDRGNEFDELIPALKGLKGIILLGESREKLKQAAEKAEIDSIHLVATIEEAVLVSRELSREGDKVLLSPACASWDQYKNFEQRGNAYKQAIKNIEK